MTKRQTPVTTVLAAILLAVTAIIFTACTKSPRPVRNNTGGETEPQKTDHLDRSSTAEPAPPHPENGASRLEKDKANAVRRRERMIEERNRGSKQDGILPNVAPNKSVKLPLDKPSLEAGPAPTDEELIDAALGRLRKGNLAYNTPAGMKTGQTAHVIARIGSDKISIQTLESGMSQKPDQKIEVSPTPVSTKMKMTLRSADFDITALSSDEQIVAGDTPTTWEWDIIPRRSGKLRLHLAAVVELQSLSKDFTTVDRDIAVQVDPVDEMTKFVKTNWQWIIATLTAIAGAAWKFFRERKKKANKVSAPPEATNS